MISIDSEPLNDGWLHSMRNIEKGGPGSGIKGHRTEKKLPKQLLLPDGVAEILYKYEYMEKLNEYQLEKFRKQILNKVQDAKKKYTEIAQYFPGDTEFERLHRKLVVDLGELENKLESAFSAGEKKIAIDAVFHLTHVHGRYAIFEGTGEDIKRVLDYIRDQRAHKNIDDFDFFKGGEGSGIKGHTIVKEKKYKNILSFENQIRTEKKENGLLCDKDGTVLLMLEGTEDTILFTPSDKYFFFNKAAGGIFTHNHPVGNSFSKADIISSMRAKLQEVRVVGKEYTYSMKFKKEVPAHIRDEFPHRYDQVFDETYILFIHKIFDGMSNRKAQQSCYHEMTQKISKEYSEYFSYERTTSFSKGGKGSGIKGHRTAKKEKPKLYKVVEDFEEKYRNRKSEIGLLVDKEGNVLLIKKGTKTKISYTPEEEKIFLHSGKSYLFTHNHYNDTSPSLADFDTAWKAKLKEIRSVGPNNTFILKIKKEIPEKVYFDMHYSFETNHNLFYAQYSAKVNRDEMKATDATIAYSDESRKAFAKEFPEYLSYERITTIKKGGVGSGIKGHETEKEKKIRKAYKLLKDFENLIKEKPIELGWALTEDGESLFKKIGNEDSIFFTEENRRAIIDSKKKVIFTHNHPTSSSFSIEDILVANKLHLLEMRVASKEHDYVMKISKPLDEDEIMASYRTQNAHYYEKFNPLVVSEKLDSHKAWMTHTHLIWKHVAKKIDGLEYKRTR